MKHMASGSARLGVAWARYIAGLEAGTNVHGRSANRPNTIACKQGVWRRWLRDTIGPKPITEVTDDDLFDIIQTIRDNGEMIVCW